MSENKREFIVVIGRRYLNRRYVDRSEDEFFAWTVDDATRYTRSIAEDMAEEYRSALPTVIVFVAHIDQPFASHIPERSSFWRPVEENEESGGLACGDDD
jgi:hypothetical protein